MCSVAYLSRCLNPSVSDTSTNLAFLVGSAKPNGNRDGNVKEQSPSKSNSFIGVLSANGQSHLMKFSTR